MRSCRRGDAGEFRNLDFALGERFMERSPDTRRVGDAIQALIAAVEYWVDREKAERKRADNAEAEVTRIRGGGSSGEREREGPGGRWSSADPYEKGRY